MSYRNHFCIGVGGDGYAEWEDLVATGMAIKRHREIDGGDDTFHLTLAAALSVREPKEHISPEDAKNMREWESSPGLNRGQAGVWFLIALCQVVLGGLLLLAVARGWFI